MVHLARSLFLAASMWLGLFHYGARAADDYAPDPALVAAANHEGRVVLYTTWIIDQLARPMIADFEARFPNVHVDYVRGDSENNLMKMITELQARSVQADVWSLGADVAALVKAGGAAELDLPSAKEIPDEYKDKDRHWIATYIVVHALSYNTNLIKAEEAPASYADLLDPKWKNKLAWKRGDVTGSSGFIANILLWMGEQKGTDYLRQLAKQNIIEYEGSVRALLDNVIAGEYPIGLQTTNYHAAISARKGALVQWKALEPAPVSMTVGGIAAGAPHPDAARLFLDFVMSKAGQDVLTKAGYLSVRPDTPAFDPSLEPGTGGFTVNVLRPEVLDANYSHWMQIERDIFQ